MKLRYTRSLYRSALLSAACSLAFNVFAADEIVSGNLEVTGSAYIADYLFAGSIGVPAPSGTWEGPISIGNGAVYIDDGVMGGVYYGLHKITYYEGVLEFPYGESGTFATKEWVASNFLGATTTFQPYSASLGSLASLSLSSNKGIYATAAGVFSTYDLTEAGRTFLSSADAAAQRSALGLTIGTQVLSPSGSGSNLSGVVKHWGDLPGIESIENRAPHNIMMQNASGNAYDGLAIYGGGSQWPPYIFLPNSNYAGAVRLMADPEMEFDYYEVYMPKSSGTLVLHSDAVVESMPNKIVRLNSSGLIDPSVLRIPPSGDLSMGSFTAGANPAAP